MLLETYLLYLAAVAVFFASPPDTSQLLIISNSLRHGIGRSAYTIAGDLTANAVQMTAAAFGLAAIIATSAAAFSLIKWLGVAYLAWIGLQLIVSKDRETGPAAANTQSASRLFRQGFVTSLANPFAVVFFGALFPQFIDPAAPILPQLLIMGATYIVIDGAILLLWGFAATRLAASVASLSFGTLNKICGGLMVGAAALLASKDLQPER